jgi:hypothetical protein
MTAGRTAASSGPRCPGIPLTRRRALPRVSVFASMTPLGILIGTGVNTLLTPRGSELFEATFDSVGAGTFLSIAAPDIISAEFEIPRDRART